MELNEMEKRMLYQTEGSEHYAILHEMLMASRYAKDPDKRRAADSLMKKLRPLSDNECMEIVHDIMALECFDPEVRHMVIFKVLSGDFFVVVKETGCACF